jgi:topoisomerase-4 subunit B
MECTFFAIDYFSTIFPELIKMDICIFYKHHFSEYKQAIYCYSDEERKVAIEKLKPKQKSPVLKVWEISPDEFKNFIR